MQCIPGNFIVTSQNIPSIDNKVSSIIERYKSRNEAYIPVYFRVGIKYMQMPHEKCVCPLGGN